MKFKLFDKRILIPFIIALLSTIIMAVSVFMPFATATDEYKESLSQATNAIVDSELGLTVESIKNISLYEFARLYNANSYDIFGDSDGFIYIVLVALIGGIALLGVIFTLFKKAIPIMVCTIFSCLIFAFNKYDFSLRGIVPSDYYTYGIGYYIYFLATILALAGAIMLLVSKIKIKKEVAKN